MPEIILLILKILGIVLAVILLVVLLFVLCTLFAPIHYKAQFVADLEKYDEEDETAKIDARVKASWLYIIKVLVEYQKEVRIRLKILGVTIFDSQKNAPKEGHATETKSIKQETSGADEETEEQPKNLIQKLRYAINQFCGKLKKIKEKKDAIINLWNDEQTVRCRGLVMQEFLYLLKHLKPDYIHGYLHFGFEDPAMTGYGMAAYGIMIPVWGDFLAVEPDFEKQILQANMRMKGKLRVFHFVKIMAKLFFSNDIRSVIKKVKALN